MTAADQIVAWGILGAIAISLLWLVVLIVFGLIREVVRKRRERSR